MEKLRRIVVCCLILLLPSPVYGTEPQRNFFKKVEEFRLELPGFSVLPPDNMSPTFARFPWLGLYVFLDKSTSLYVTPRYGGLAPDGATLIHKELRSDSGNGFALTVLEDDLWSRRYRYQGVQIGAYVHPPFPIKLYRFTLRFGLNVGYDIERNGIVYLRVNLIP